MKNGDETKKSTLEPFIVEKPEYYSVASTEILMKQNISNNFNVTLLQSIIFDDLKLGESYIHLSDNRRKVTTLDIKDIDKLIKTLIEAREVLEAFKKRPIIVKENNYLCEKNEKKTE